MPLPPLKKILCVDDAEEILVLLKAVLDLAGYTVATCADAAEALQAAPEFLPDLIFLDVNMPDMDGPDVLIKLREFPQLKATPVVFLTAQYQEHEVAGYFEMGVAGVFAKPFDPMRLPQQLDSLWKQISH
jgi:CheY-like chemotaxis protein